MQIIEETIQSGRGYQLHVIPATKFKTIHVVVKFKERISRKTITKRALLPYLLQKGTKQYPTERSLQAKLDELYGASLSIDGGKKGDDHILSFRLEVANDRFIADENSLIEEALAFLKDVIFQSKIMDKNNFSEDVFAREKEILRQKIQSIVDDKIAFANRRLIDEMCKDETYAIHVSGYEEDLDSLTSEELSEYYQTVLLNNEVDIYILGDFNEDEMIEKGRATFNEPLQVNEHLATMEERKVEDPKRTAIQEVIEKQEIQQAKLHIGFRTNTTYQDEAYFALQVFNGLFGTFPSSKLFIHVREKNSLAYYVSSRLESHKGLLIVLSGIAGSDYVKTREIIDLQLKAMREGDFTAEELEKTKHLLINQLLETMDHPQGIVELLYQQVVGDRQLPPAELIEGIRQVTTEEVISIAQKIEEDTVYLLTNEEETGDA